MTSDFSASGSWSTTISVAGTSGGRSPPDISCFICSIRSELTPSNETTRATAIEASLSGYGEPSHSTCGMLCAVTLGAVPENHFGEAVAARYDSSAADMFEPAVVDPVVDFLAALAGDGPAL